MADVTVYILSPRTGTGTPLDPHRAKVIDDYPIPSWSHLTERRNPPVSGSWSVDVMVIRATVNNAILSQIEADTRYVVLSDMEIVSPTKAGRLDANLRAKGMGREKAADLKNMVRRSSRLGAQELIRTIRLTGGA